MTFWTDMLGLPFEIKFVDAGGTRTRTLIAGHGEPVVFLHGISGHLEAFVGNARGIIEAGFQVHMIDMIGQGYTDPLTEPMTIQLMSNHVGRYLDAVGLDKVHLAGLSLGGWTAGWFASHHPERVLSLQLISAAGDPTSKPANDPKFGEWIRQSTRDGVLGDWQATRTRLLQVVTNPDDLKDELIDVRYAVYHRPEFVASLDFLLGMTSPEDFTRSALMPEMLAKITAETLVIWGENDMTSGAGPKWLIENIKKVKLITFEGNSHWPQYERPKEYMRVAVEFLKHGLAGVTTNRL